MGWTYYTYTKENVSVDDMQKIINEFPSNWFYLGESKRDEKPIRQDWGWSTIVDIDNPWHNWKDDDYGLGVVGVVTVGGAGFSVGSGEKVNSFVVRKLREFGYTILKESLSC